MTQRKTAQEPRRDWKLPRKGALKPAASGFREWVANSPRTRSIGRYSAQAAGLPVGVGRGLVSTAKGIGQGATFMGRLLVPDIDEFLSPPGRSAWDQVERAGKSAVGYARRGVANPDRVLNDIKAVGRQLNRDLNPAATPPAKTLGGELKRNFEIGKNQGAAITTASTLAVGGGARKVVSAVQKAGKVEGPERYIAQGFNPKQAVYLAGSYEGMGAHYFPRSGIPKKLFGHKLPKRIVGLKLPKKLSDSRYNVLKPKGISRGKMYEDHFTSDLRFNVARMPGGDLWMGKPIGLQKHDPLERLVVGAPDALKAVIGRATVAGTLVGGGESRRSQNRK